MSKRLGIGLFLLALLIRVVGIGWGLPNSLHNQSYHPDELVIWSYSQQIEPTRLDFDPGFYNYGTLYLSMLRVAGDVVQGYGAAEGESPWQAIGRTHLAGRCLSAAFGAGAVLFVFWALRRRTGLFASALGAAALALAPGHVVHSRFQTVDVAAAFFLAGSLFFALDLLRPQEERSGRWSSDRSLSVLAGVFAGLSAGTKYTGILALLALLASLWLMRRPGWLREFGFGICAALGAFVLATPGALLHPQKFLEDVRYEMLHTGTGHGLVFAGYPSGFVTHAVNLAVGFGTILLLLGAAGLVGGAVRKRGWAIVLLAFAVPYFVLIGRAEVLFLRYTFPLMVVLALGFGAMVGWAHRSKGWAMAVVALGIVGLGGLDGGGAKGTALMSAWMLGEDPRDEAGRYLKEAAQREGGTTVGVPDDPWFYTPALYPDTGLPRWVPFADRDRARREAADPRVLQFVPEDPGQRFDWDVRLIERDRPDRIVFGSFEWNDVARLRGARGLAPDVAVQVERAEAFQAALERAYTLERVFGLPTVPVHDLQYIRPTLWVWKRKT